MKIDLELTSDYNVMYHLKVADAEISTGGFTTVVLVPTMGMLTTELLVLWVPMVNWPACYSHEPEPFLWF